MKFVADLHLHSHFSRATSPQLNLEHLHKSAQLKGITVIGTGDFVHPGWLKELQEKLEPAEPGLFKLKPEFARATQTELPGSCTGEVRFTLTAEISNIYKRLGKVRKVHNIVLVPSFAAAQKMQARLEAIGNIRADGRPILGLDSRDLLEITLDTDPLAYLIPAHIWTPWFSALGSNSGFDSIEECFADLTPEIFAVETGLSSDPPMNWRLQQLDRFVLVSNSDAHSPQKLAREANVFDTELSYPAIHRALKEKDDPGLIATLEFFPEEGKYHYDGHRACKTRLHPRETMANAGKCPVCGKEVTVGVMARVEELADRPEGEKSARWRPYENLIPLPEIIAEARNQGVTSKSVSAVFETLLAALGNELFILQEAPLSDIERVAGTFIAEGIRRMRAGEVRIAAGYDGEYGHINLFTAEDREKIVRQTSFLPPSSEARTNVALADDTCTTEKPLRVMDTIVAAEEAESTSGATLRNRDVAKLSASQEAAVQHGVTHLLIVAGPGSGKTHTLTHRIARVAKTLSPNSEMLCITFTNKAAEELRQRIDQLLDAEVTKLFAGTFHAFCLQLLKQYANASAFPEDFQIITESEKDELAKSLWPQLSVGERAVRLEIISLLKSTIRNENNLTVEDAARRELDAAMRQQHKLDFDDLLIEAIRLLEHNAAIRNEIQKRYRWIFVDEYQDINAAQQTLLKLLIGEDNVLTAIGDPDQSIYGFRGSRPDFFTSFPSGFPGATILQLRENYRSAPALLSAAAQVIAAAPSRLAVPLSPTLLTQGRLVIHNPPTANAEAEYVVHQIEKMVGGTSLFSQDSGRVGHHPAGAGERSFGEIAVLYRLNALRPPLQEALDRAGMPYQISGEIPLIDRPGVRPLITALRLAGAMPVTANEIAKLIVFAVDGFGQQAGQQLSAALQNENQLTIESVRQLARKSTWRQKQRQSLEDFCGALNDAALSLAKNGVAATTNLLIASTPYFTDLGNTAKAEEIFQRVLYLARRHARLQDFLNALALQRDLDDFTYHPEKISLLTLHAAKGLEFNVVFIIGCEETLLPMSLPGLAADPDEERRLFYVGMTRAKEQLFLLRAARRSLFGKFSENPASRFLADIEERLKEHEAWPAPARKASTKTSENQLKLF